MWRAETVAVMHVLMKIWDDRKKEEKTRESRRSRVTGGAVHISLSPTLEETSRVYTSWNASLGEGRERERAKARARGHRRTARIGQENRVAREGKVKIPGTEASHGTSWNGTRRDSTDPFLSLCLMDFSKVRSACPEFQTWEGVEKTMLQVQWDYEASLNDCRRELFSDVNLLTVEFQFRNLW